MNKYKEATECLKAISVDHILQWRKHALNTPLGL